MSYKRIILGIAAVVCFCAWGAEASEQGEIYGWGGRKLLNGQTLTNIIKITGGHGHSLALKSDGSIVGWGYDTYGQATTPEGNDYVAIAAGWGHSLALKSDGSIVGWGYDHYGQATPPVGTTFIAIAAGNYHSLALKSDGSIVGWGDNSDGQATPPAGTDYVSIAAGGYHSLALKSDGSIIGWGYNDEGQATPPEGTDYVAISAGYSHNLALKSDGSIVGWGTDNDGQATPPEGNDFIAIAAGTNYSLAIRVVLEPVDLLHDLGEEVIGLEIPAGVGNGLTAKLDTAIKLLEQDSKNNTEAAINLLDAFIESVENFSDVQIQGEDADALITAAQQIIDILSSD